jgi:hypothetical protein
MWRHTIASIENDLFLYRHSSDHVLGNLSAVCASEPGTLPLMLEKTCFDRQTLGSACRQAAFRPGSGTFSLPLS